jgi:hypothetical protein
MKNLSILLLLTLLLTSCGKVVNNDIESIPGENEIITNKTENKSDDKSVNNT